MLKLFTTQKQVNLPGKLCMDIWVDAIHTSLTFHSNVLGYFSKQKTNKKHQKHWKPPTPTKLSLLRHKGFSICQIFEYWNATISVITSLCSYHAVIWIYAILNIAFSNFCLFFSTEFLTTVFVLSLFQLLRTKDMDLHTDNRNTLNFILLVRQIVLCHLEVHQIHTRSSI